MNIVFHHGLRFEDMIRQSSISEVSTISSKKNFPMSVCEKNTSDCANAAI